MIATAIEKTIEHVNKFINDYTSEIALDIIGDVTATLVQHIDLAAVIDRHCITHVSM